MSVLGNGKLRSSFRKLRYGAENGGSTQDQEQKLQVKLDSGKLSLQSHISAVSNWCCGTAMCRKANLSKIIVGAFYKCNSMNF